MLDVPTDAEKRAGPRCYSRPFAVKNPLATAATS